MEIAIFTIGITSIVFFLILYFTPFADTKVETRSTVPLDIGTPGFLQAAESIANTKARPLAAYEILSNGDEYAKEIVESLKKAEHSITFTNYILKEGRFADSILDALTERAKAGVEVRLLLDGKGSLGNPEDKVVALKEAGGKVAIFRPLNPLLITRLNKRSHVRAVVIDGKVAYTGGAAIEDGWLGDGIGKEHWRDLMFKFEGEAAESLQDVFNNLWRQTDGEILSGEGFYPSIAHTAAEPCTSSCFVSLFHSPVPDLEKSVSNLLWLSIAGTKDHIYLETPYLLPDKNIMRALKERALAGVDVEIIVPGPFIDSKVVQAASRSYYKSALESGIRIYEYQPAGYHPKVLTADGRWSLIGSANLDNRSSTLNVENVMGILDEKFAEGLDEEFAKNKAEAKEVTLESYKPSLFYQMGGMISRLFAKQY